MLNVSFFTYFYKDNAQAYTKGNAFILEAISSSLGI